MHFSRWTVPPRILKPYAGNTSEELHVAEPQLCLLGIGENGHIAFNEPAEADFHDPLEMKIVTLDLMCRQQQAAEGWFPTWQEAPERALTLTIPTVFRVPKLIASVPGPRKAQVIRRTVHDPISTACPSTLLRTHPDITVYLDTDSAAELEASAHWQNGRGETADQLWSSFRPQRLHWVKPRAPIRRDECRQYGDS